MSIIVCQEKLLTVCHSNINLLTKIYCRFFSLSSHINTTNYSMKKPSLSYHCTRASIRNPLLFHIWNHSCGRVVSCSSYCHILIFSHSFDNKCDHKFSNATYTPVDMHIDEIEFGHARDFSFDPMRDNQHYTKLECENEKKYSHYKKSIMMFVIVNLILMKIINVINHNFQN